MFTLELVDTVLVTDTLKIHHQASKLSAKFTRSEMWPIFTDYRHDICEICTEMDCFSVHVDASGSQSFFKKKKKSHFLNRICFGCLLLLQLGFRINLCHT